MVFGGRLATAQVKGGEDLRNDERIEQLLTLMNSVLASDGAASSAGLRLRTYSVVPMTTEVRAPRTP